jgi:hypothetical protein
MQRSVLIASVTRHALMPKASLMSLACVVLLSCSSEQPGQGETPQSEAPVSHQANDQSPPEPQPEFQSATADVAGKRIEPPAIPDACRYDGLTEALAVARARWQGTGINTYSMTIQRSSFHQLAVWPNSTTLKLKVRNGQASGNLRGVDLTWLQSLTVDGLFEYIESQASKHPDCLKVQFDSMFGYPTSIQIDPVFGGTDDELEFAVTEFGP